MTPRIRKAGSIISSYLGIAIGRAKIIEVLLIRSGFLSRISRPLLFEFCGGHCNKVMKSFRKRNSRHAVGGPDKPIDHEPWEGLASMGARAKNYWILVIWVVVPKS